MKRSFRILLLLLAAVMSSSCVSAPDLQLHDPGGAEVEVLVRPMDAEYWGRTMGIFDFTYGANRNDLGMRLSELAERFLVRKGYFTQTERTRMYGDVGLEQAFALARSRGHDLVLMGKIVKYEQGTGRSEVEMQVDILEVATGKTLWRILGRLGSQDLLKRAGPSAARLSEELLPEMLAALSQVPEPAGSVPPVPEPNPDPSADPANP